jgi:hypothetical protein
MEKGVTACLQTQRHQMPSFENLLEFLQDHLHFLRHFAWIVSYRRPRRAQIHDLLDRNPVSSSPSPSVLN